MKIRHHRLNTGTLLSLSNEPTAFSRNILCTLCYVCMEQKFWLHHLVWAKIWTHVGRLDAGLGKKLWMG